MKLNNERLNNTQYVEIMSHIIRSSNPRQSGTVPECKQHFRAAQSLSCCIRNWKDRGSPETAVIRCTTTRKKIADYYLAELSNFSAVPST